MTIRTTLMGSLATAALLSGAALAQEAAETETDAVELTAEGGDASSDPEAGTPEVAVTTTTVPVQPVEGETPAEPVAEMAEDAPAEPAQQPAAIAGEAPAGESPAEAVTEMAEEAPEAEAGTSAETVVVTEADRDAPSSGAYGAFAATLVSDLLGMNVLDAGGEDVGEVDQLVSFDGAPSAIVGVGGFLGMGEHDVAVPLARFEMTEEGLVLPDLAEDDLRAMEEWDGESGTEMRTDLTVEDAS